MNRGGGGGMGKEKYPPRTSQEERFVNSEDGKERCRVVLSS